MKYTKDPMAKFFGVIGDGQSYLNALYMLLAFPLGIFYFVFLVTGIAAGVPLLIIWIGIPILLMVAGGIWLMAAFERQIAILILKEEIGPMYRPVEAGTDVWVKIKEYLTNPVTWKSILYLFLKFPMGIVGFVVLVTMGALSLAFLASPVIYSLWGVGITVDVGPGVLWQVDTMGEAVLAALFGLLLWPVSMHVINGMAWVSSKFAKVMLGLETSAPVEAESAATSEVDETQADEDEAEDEDDEAEEDVDEEEEIVEENS